MPEKPAKPCVYTLAKFLVDSEPSNNSDGLRQAPPMYTFTIV